MKTPQDEWLEGINREFRADNVDVRRRPYLAIDRYCQDFRVKSIVLDTGPGRRIIDWFQKNTDPKMHHIGSLFKGAFYYDACFWPVEIPIGYGLIRINAKDCLKGMPSHIKNDLIAASHDTRDYTMIWCDCFDYAYGFDDMSKSGTSNEFGHALLKNGNMELQTAVSQLLEPHPNPKAGMSSRMAVEIFLKAFLALKNGLTDKGAKSLGHNLTNILEECEKVDPLNDLLIIKSELSLFPEIHERYTGTDVSSPLLWKVYRISQYTAAATIRSFTDRDTRAQFQLNIDKI